MSDNVFQFPQRAKPEEKPEQDVGPAPTVPTEATPQVAQMLTGSAAMTVIATLAFYAQQGWDGGKRARAATPALQQLLATKGIALMLPQT